MFTRARICLMALGALFALLGARLFYLQCALHPFFEAKAEKQHVARIPQPARRGTFFYRDGRQAAWTLQADSIFAVPTLVEDPAATATALSPILGVSAAELGRELEKGKAAGRTFHWVKRWVEPVPADQVRRLGLEGIGFVQEPRRAYPFGPQAANLLGFMGRDGNGLSGLEQQYDRWLRGKPGTLCVLRDARRRLLMVPAAEGEPKQDGMDVVLTLDSRIQAVAEAQMDEAVRQFSPQHACAIVMDPFTGDILAMANRPGYDPNRFSAENPDHFKNWAASFVYEPGSTFKPFVLSAALEQGAVSPSDRIDCERGHWKVGSRELHDHEPYGILTVEEVLAQSSNIGMAKIGMKVPKEALHDTLQGFGFGSRPGAWLPGEETGVLHPARKWTRDSLMSIPMGHEVSSTPLQLLRAFCVFANGGYLPEPSVVAQGRSSDGKTFGRTAGRGPKLLSDDTLEKMRGMLVSVVEKGTGKGAQCEYAVAGKTGTSQKIVGKKHSSEHHVATFVAFAPAEDPKVAVLVMVDDPRGGSHYASVVAVPAAREILRQSLRLMGIEPEKGERRALSRAETR